MDRAEQNMSLRSHLGIEKQIGSISFEMVLHDTWTKASIFFFFFSPELFCRMQMDSDVSP